MKTHDPFRPRVCRADSAIGLAAGIRSRLRGDAGSALVELALFLAFLGVPLFTSVAYFGTVLIDQIEVDNAAYSGAMYAMTSSANAENTSLIQTAAQEDSSRFGSNLTVTPSVFYACSIALSGTQYSTEAAATSACSPSPNHALEMAQVTVSVTVTPPLTVPGLPKTKTLTSTIIMEVQE